MRNNNNNTHTHKTTFLKLILLIEFCRLNWAVTQSVRDSTPGQGNPWPIFCGISKIGVAIQQPHLQVPSMSGSTPKKGFKVWCFVKNIDIRCDQPRHACQYLSLLCKCQRACKQIQSKPLPIIFYTFESEDIFKSHDLSQSKQVKWTVYFCIEA